MVLMAFLSWVCGIAVEAQDQCEATISADFVSQYIWRGQELGQVSVQPTLGIDCKGFSLSAWGSVGLSQHEDAKEIDLTLSYTTGGFSAGVTDYWTDEAGPRYFLYDAHRTNHVFEAFAGYDFGVAAVTWYTNFAGADGTRSDGSRAYSSYLELSAPFSLAGLEWSAGVGVVPYSTTLYDTDGFAVTHLGLTATKDVQVTDKFTLPLFASVLANPRTRNAYLVVGFTLRP